MLSRAAKSCAPVSGFGPIANTGLNAHGLVPNFTSLPMVKLFGTDHWSLTQSKVDFRVQLG